MSKTNEWLKRTLETVTYPGLEITYQKIRPYVRCADGFCVSIQASDGHYCSPRVKGDVTYDTVELGFPSIEEPLIAGYAEDPDNLTNTVYGWVPVEIVDQVIEKHGGIVN